MNIIKYIHHSGDIKDISMRHPSLARFQKSVIKKNKEFKWHLNGSNVFEWNAVVSFFGKSGYGKSSTVNAFFGDKILNTSDVEACTYRCDCINFKIKNDYLLSFSDFPGIGENEYKDEKYLNMYRDFMKSSNVIVYVLRADMRDYSIDENAFKVLFQENKDKKKVILAVNCCDKIEPINRSSLKSPSKEQMDNIKNKIKDLEKIFKPYNPIVPYSAQTKWNLEALSEAIVAVSEKCGDIIFYK